MPPGPPHSPFIRVYIRPFIFDTRYIEIKEREKYLFHTWFVALFSTILIFQIYR